MQVKILNPDQAKDLFYWWGMTSKVCYDTKTNNPAVIGNHCMNSGHYSGSRSQYILFQVDDCPRFCYDEQTEILTSEGWKYFKDISNNEIVATLNPNTNKVEFNQITEKINYLYEGDMYDIKNTMIDLSVTKGHNLYLKPFDRPDRNLVHKWGLTECEKSPYLFKMNKNFDYTPKNKIEKNIVIKGFSYLKKQCNGAYTERTTKDLILNRKTFYQFLAWYLSDGSCRYDKKENKYVITITQAKSESNTKNKTRERIIQLVKDMGLTPTPTEKSIYITNLTLGKFLYELGTAGVKYIPLNLFEDFDKEYAQLFLNEYFKGDGHIDKNGVGFIYTGSFKLASQIQTLCFLAGWTALLRERNKDHIGTKRMVCGRLVNINLPSYVVNVCFSDYNRYPTVKKTRHFSVRQTKEQVYCVNVPNHIIFVRKNGRAVWCGNCTDQTVRHEVGVMKNVQSFRYVDKHSFAYEVPVEITTNQALMARYIQHMNDAIELYTDIQFYVLDKTKSKERANEQARYVLPMATHTSFVIGMDIEALIHFCNMRLCVRTEEVHRRLAKLIRDATLEVLPELKNKLVPNCQYLLWCPEGKASCGAYPTKDELKEKLNGSIG